VLLWLSLTGRTLSFGLGSWHTALHGFAASDPNAQAKTLLVTVPIATIAWLIVTFSTAPEPDERLAAFYRRVRPSPAGWRRIARLAGTSETTEPLGVDIVDWFAGCGLVYGALFGIGKFVLGDPITGLAYLGLAVFCLAIILRTSIITASRPASQETSYEIGGTASGSTSGG